MSEQLPSVLDFLAILSCPITGNDLRELNPEELSALNTLVEQRELFHYEGSQETQAFHRALTSSCGKFYYRIEQGVLILLKNLALTTAEHLNQEEDRSGLMKDKKDVQDFYNQFGWNKTEDGVFHDADEFEDLRPVSQEYVYDCNMRVKNYLRPKGDYLLDAASGPIQFDEYLEYSKDYKYRICMDLSFLALRQAREKLGNRGIYLVADITNMPLKAGTIDAVVSLNTIYHITKDEQVTAVQEMYRVLKPEATGIVVYSWGRRSHLNNFLALPHKIVRKLKAVVRTSMPQKEGKTPELYFHAHPRSYFTSDRLGFDMKLSVWRLVSVPVMKYYVHGWLGGKALLRSIYRLEDKRPEWCGKVGEYPMFVFQKKVEDMPSHSQPQENKELAFTLN